MSVEGNGATVISVRVCACANEPPAVQRTSPAMARRTHVLIRVPSSEVKLWRVIENDRVIRCNNSLEQLDERCLLICGKRRQDAPLDLRHIRPQIGQQRAALRGEIEPLPAPVAIA